ncbi:BrnT family toxin [Allorhizobium sp. NPDC080224]|uniref:BrnT family toxin n=1 Tax=Allorhizobium sp. NPDC080224 TaxID=3390547 RepID=UPI003CFBE90C
MIVEYDQVKEEANRQKHGISLERAGELDILALLQDDRNAYGEIRYRAWGLIDGQPHRLAFTYRDGHVRAISLRRAHKKEFERYVESNR